MEVVTTGPLINDAAFAKVEVHLADAVAKGASIALGGQRSDRGENFFQPTVLTDVTSDMKIAREETIGPIAPLFQFEAEADVVRMANDT